MTDFEFDTAPSPGTNRTAPTTDCPTCGGDRFVPVDVPAPVTAAGTGGYTEAMMPCPQCGPGVTREPVEEGAWWKE